MLHKEPFFVKPKRLLELNQDLFGLPVSLLLLQNQCAEQAAPDEARESH